MLKNNAPFRSRISKINNILSGNSEDLDYAIMPLVEIKDFNVFLM